MSFIMSKKNIKVFCSFSISRSLQKIFFKMSKNSLEGKTVVFTGTLRSLTTIKLDEATAKAKTAGAKVVGSVGANTNILVAGPDTEKKIGEAQSKSASVEIWDEETLEILEHREVSPKREH
jgi:DNA ligase (NAD+)